MPRINATTNYGSFDSHMLNRAISWPNVRKIEHSMEADGFRDNWPILVVRHAGQLVIVDGHHRFYAAKSLGLPIKYTVMDCSLETAMQIIISHAITNRPWTMRDCVEFHDRRGLADYGDLLAYSDATGISLSQSAGLLSGSGGSAVGADALKRGDFQIVDTDLADDTALVVEATTNVLGRREGARVALVQAIAGLCCVTVFDIDTAIKQITGKGRHLVIEVPGKENNVKMIEAVYNYGAKAKPPLHNIERQVAGARRRAKGNRSKYHDLDRYKA